MNKYIFYFLLFSVSSRDVRAQGVGLAAPYTLLMGYSASQGDAFSANRNTAALGSLKHFQAGIYGEQRYALSGLGWYEMALVFPAAAGNFRFSGSYFGQKGYNESLLGLGYAREMGKVSAGVQFNYEGVDMGVYGKDHAFTAEGGVIFSVSELVRAGIHVYNPTRSGFIRGKESRPLTVSAGVGYDVSTQVYLGAAIQKAEDGPTRIKAVVQYAFSDMLFSRAGISGGSFYLGGGFLLPPLRIDLTASLHPYLGISPGILILYKGMK